MDLTTLLTLTSLFFGIVVSNAALFGDSLFVSMQVPNKMSQAGFSSAAAESVFATEMAKYTQAPSILATPSVSTSSSPGLTMALAKPLKLEGVVYAVQAQVRHDVVSVNGSIVADDKGPGLTLYLTINNPPDPPVAMTVSQPDGDTNALLQHGARETMIDIAPYLVGVTDLIAGLNGDKDGFTRAKQTAMTGLSQPWDPSTEGATETALQQNMLGVLAIRDGDLKDAETRFELAETTPNSDPAVYGVVALNRAFLAIVKKDPVSAQEYFARGDLATRKVREKDFGSRVSVLGGLVAWSTGHREEAEEMLRSALARTSYNNADAHLYLAELLDARGDTAGAARERKAAASAKRFEPMFPSLAHTLLWVDPINGGIRAHP